MKTEELVTRLIGEVDPELVRERLFHLAQDPLPFRKVNFTLPGHAKSTLEEADDYIADRLAAWGYAVSREPVQVQAFRCDATKPKAQQFSPPRRTARRP